MTRHVVFIHSTGLGPFMWAPYKEAAGDARVHMPVNLGYAPGSEEIDGEELPWAEDGGFGQQYEELVYKHTVIRRPVAVPTISVATPFDGIAVLKQLKSHITTWPEMKLLDAKEASSISTNLQSAIDALSAGNKGAAIKTLRSIRPELNQLQSSGIKSSGDKVTTDETQTDQQLAESVLVFDLKFIISMLGSE